MGACLRSGYALPPTCTHRNVSSCLTLSLTLFVARHLVAESTSAGPQVLAVEPRGTSKTVYRQRFPILGIDWTPWRSRGAIPHPLSTGVAPVADANGTRHQLGFLICYEAYLTLPAIETIAAAPETIVVMANDRWSRGTLYPEGGAKIRAAMAWAAGVPVVAARNT